MRSAEVGWVGTVAEIHGPFRSFALAWLGLDEVCGGVEG